MFYPTTIKPLLNPTVVFGDDEARVVDAEAVVETPVVAVVVEEETFVVVSTLLVVAVGTVVLSVVEAGKVGLKPPHEILISYTLCDNFPENTSSSVSASSQARL